MKIYIFCRGRYWYKNIVIRNLIFGKYSDTYVQELRKLIEAKSKERKFVSTSPKEKGPTKDLLEALKASIDTKKM
jgi:non-homologous end joining protein Ku